MSIYDNMEEGLATAYSLVQRRLNGVHTPATLSKGERKKCKSCVSYPDCKYCYKPMQVACDGYKRKKKR